MELTTTPNASTMRWHIISSLTAARAARAERALLVLDGLDDALAGGGAGREEAGEDTYEEA